MRNKTAFNILKKDKKTGEFTSTRRFNHKDYIMSSIFDNENKENKEDIFHRLSKVNEGFIDNLDIDDIDMGEEEEETGIMAATESGGEIEIMLSEDKISNAFFCSVLNMILIDDKKIEQYSNIDSIIKKRGNEKSRKLHINNIVYAGGTLKFVVSDFASFGVLELNYLDDECTEVTITFSPTSGKFGFHHSYISLNYPDFCKLSKYSRFVKKKPHSYYGNLVPALIEKFNQNGITITLTERIRTILGSEFREPQDKFILKKLKPIVKYAPNEIADIDTIKNAVFAEAPKIASFYNSLDKFVGSEYNEDEKWVIVAKGDKFIRYFFDSSLSKLTRVDKDNFVNIEYDHFNGTKTVKVTALAMPLQCFMIVAPLFYIFLSNDSLE